MFDCLSWCDRDGLHREWEPTKGETRMDGGDGNSWTSEIKLTKITLSSNGRRPCPSSPLGVSATATFARYMLVVLKLNRQNACEPWMCRRKSQNTTIYNLSRLHDSEGPRSSVRRMQGEIRRMCRKRGSITLWCIPKTMECEGCLHFVRFVAAHCISYGCLTSEALHASMEMDERRQ